MHTRIAWLQATFKVLVPIQHTLSSPISNLESGWLLFVCYRYNNTTTHRSPSCMHFYRVTNRPYRQQKLNNGVSIISWLYCWKLIWIDQLQYVLKSRCMYNLQIVKGKRNINHIWINNISIKTVLYVKLSSVSTVELVLQCISSHSLLWNKIPLG